MQMEFICGLKGNQVRNLSDPVTVSREYFLTNPLYNVLYEKERKICRSASQETCFMLEERLPKKVQFLSKCQRLLYLSVS